MDQKIRSEVRNGQLKISPIVDPWRFLKEEKISYLLVPKRLRVNQKSFTAGLHTTDVAVNVSWNSANIAKLNQSTDTKANNNFKLV